MGTIFKVGARGTKCKACEGTRQVRSCKVCGGRGRVRTCSACKGIGDGCAVCGGAGVVPARSERELRAASYLIKYRDARGLWVRESAHSADLQVAKDLLRRRESEVAKGLTVRPGNERFAAVAERWLKAHAHLHAHEDDQLRYAKHLAPALGNLRLRDIHPGTITNLASEKVAGGLSAATARRVVSLLRRMLNWAIRQGDLAESPFRRIGPRELPKEDPPDYEWFSEDELAKILEAAPPKERPFYEAAIGTGMRLGELAALRWVDIDLDSAEPMFNVRRSWDGKPKSGKVRRIPVGAHLAPLLTAWRANCPPTSAGLVFPAPRARRETPDGPLVYGMRDARSTLETFQRLCESAGVRVLRFHDLRHSFATHFMRKGGNLYNLKAILGHSTIVLTERYAHHDPRFMRDDIDRLDFAPRPTGVVGVEAVRRERKQTKDEGGDGGCSGDSSSALGVGFGTKEGSRGR